MRAQEPNQKNATKRYFCRAKDIKVLVLEECVCFYVCVCGYARSPHSDGKKSSSHYKQEHFSVLVKVEIGRFGIELFLMTQSAFTDTVMQKCAAYFCV